MGKVSVYVNGREAYSDKGCTGSCCGCGSGSSHHRESYSNSSREPVRSREEQFYESSWDDLVAGAPYIDFDRF